MKSRERVGIKGYGAYIPFQRLPSTEVARVWKGGGSGPNLEKAVASIDEDTVTMAIEASQYAVKMAGIEELGAIFVGTESKPYAVKPTSTIVAQALGQHYTLAADLDFAGDLGAGKIEVITQEFGQRLLRLALCFYPLAVELKTELDGISLFSHSAGLFPSTRVSSVRKGFPYWDR